MDLQDFFNSKYGLGIAIAIGRFLPPKIGLLISDLLATIIASMGNLTMVKAIKANQWIVSGINDLSPRDLKVKAKSVLKHSGRCYYDLYHTFNDPEKILKLCPNSAAITEIVNLSHDGKGVFVVAPHTSNFDLALRALALHGLNAMLLGTPTTYSGYEIQNDFRTSTGMEVIPFDEPDIFSRAVKILKNGGVVATGVDRPVEKRKEKNKVSFFGHPSALPVGYIQIALAADVPILVMAPKMCSNGTYEIMHSGLITLKRNANRFTEIKQNVEMILEIVAGYIKQAPEQWLMFYPVWPDAVEELP